MPFFLSKEADTISPPPPLYLRFFPSSRAYPHFVNSTIGELRESSFHFGFLLSPKDDSIRLLFLKFVCSDTSLRTYERGPLPSFFSSSSFFSLSLKWFFLFVSLFRIQNASIFFFFKAFDSFVLWFLLSSVSQPFSYMTPLFSLPPLTRMGEPDSSLAWLGSVFSAYRHPLLSPPSRGYTFFFPFTR